MPRCIYHKGGGGAARLLTFRNDFNKSGYANLPQTLTINGVTKTPTFRYEADDATTSAWTATVGSDLAIAGSGDDPVIDEYAPGLNDKRVKFNGGKVFQDSGASLGNVSTNDFTVELVGKITSSLEGVIDKKLPTGDGIGWYVITASSSLRLTLDVGATNTNVNTAALTPGCYYHAICFVDRSGLAQWYVNGVASGSAVDVSSQSATIDSARNLTLGNASNASLSYCAMWQGANWLDTHLQADLAKERFYKCCGMYPQLAKGTALPTVSTRSTTAYLDKLDSSDNRLLVPVGAEWLRVCERIDTNGDALAGYLSETAGTNELLASQDFTSALDWTLTRCTINANATTAPDGTLTADGLIASVDVNQTHEVQQSIASTATEHVFSVWLKAGAKTWAALHAPSVANAKCYYDLGNGVLGTAGAGCTGQIEAWGNGWYRCTMVYTGGAPAHSHDIHAAEDDNDDTYTGDGSTTEIYMWGAMHDDAGLGIAGSYIKTTAAEVTRTKDQLRFVAGANIGGEDVGQGTVSMDILIPDYTTTNSLAWFSISDGNSGDNRILSYETSGVHRLICTDGGVAQASLTETVDLKDNEIHNIEALYKTNSIKMKIDGLEVGTEDTSCTIPDDIDYLEVGQSLAASQPNSLISNFKVYKKQV